MTNVALIFPGQGSQKVGMGLEFYQNSPQARAIFESAGKICANGLSKVIFEGPEERLTSTAYCQPAIFTTSVAALEAFRASSKFQNYSVQFTAGHSLGEYAALYAAGVLQFEDALRLVQKRASFMEEAARQHQGAMAAVIGFDAGQLMEICRQTGAEVANFNSHEQIVISGPAPKVQASIEAVKAAGGQKVIPLTVSGAFHSSLMSAAANRFTDALQSVKFHSPQMPVLSNVTGQPHVIPAPAPPLLLREQKLAGKAEIQDFDQIRGNLARQINSPVQWVKCVEFMAAQGTTSFIEIGPGRVLKGLIRRIDSSMVVANIEKPQDIADLPL